MGCLSLIVAMAHDRVTGIENRLPWRLPDDLKWFRRNTVGKPVIMGRNTYDSIGRPLPDRRTIVVSRDGAFRPDGVEVAASLPAALALSAAAPETMVAGGASVYAQLLPQADRLYLTRIDAAIAGDAWFPELDAAAWRECFREEHPAADGLPAYTFLILERASQE